MAIVVKDRVKVTTSTTGTGTLTLGSAESGFQAFSVIGDGNQTYYAIKSDAGFEVGIGTYTHSGTTLSRDTILESSNSGSAVSLTGTSTVFTTYPAERSSFRNVGVARDYTASGSITAGKPLILNTNYTVTQVAETSTTFAVGSVQEIDSSSGNSDYFNIYDSYRNKVVAIYRKGSGSYNLVYRVGTIDTSANTITYSSEANITTGGMHSLFAVYDEVQQATIVFYNDNTAEEGRANVITLDSSGNGTVSSAQTFSSNSTGEVSAVYTGSSKTVISYEDSSTLKSRVVSLSGTTLSFGTVADVSSSTPNNTCIAYDSDQQKVLIVHRDAGNSYYVTEELGTISGTDVTYTSSVKISASSPFPDNERNMTYDQENQKILLNLYTSNTNQIYVITVSGSSTTWGSANQYSTTSNEATISYNATSKSTLLGYRNTSNNYPIARSVTLSGSTVTFGTETQVSTTNADGNDIATASAGAKSIISYVDNSNANYDGAVVTMPSSSTNLTKDNYFGIASSSASDTEAVGVNRPGSINIDQTGLTAGKDYYAKSDGTIVERTTTTNTTNDDPTVAFTTMNDADTVSSDGEAQMVYDSTSETFVVSYENPSNSDYPTVVAGTWSNGTMTWGTPVVLESNSSNREIGIAVGNGKVWTAWARNSGNIMITSLSISGTTITVATPTDTSIAYSNELGIKLSYDISSDYLLLFNSNQSTGSWLFKVKPYYTTSGGGLTAGTTSTIVTNGSIHHNEFDVVYDPDTSRTVVVYTDDSNSNYGTANVIQSSGTSGSPTVTIGSDVVFSGTDAVDGLTATYDTVNDKVFVGYHNTTDGITKGIIGSVTGGGTNSISFAGEGTINDYTAVSSSYLDIVYDADVSKIFAVYRDDDHTSDGLTYRVITPSASSFAVSSASVITTNDNQLQSGAGAYGQNKGVVVASRDVDNSSKLSISTLYYGTTSSTTINASQFVGTARSGTDLELAEPPTELVGLANGSITKGDSVVLRTDGDFEKVALSSTTNTYTYSKGTETELSDDAGTTVNSVYDANADRFVVTHQKSSFGKAIVVSTSGTTPTVEDTVSFSSGLYNGEHAIPVYDSTNNRVAIIYTKGNDNNKGASVVGTVGASTISFGSEVVYNSDSNGGSGGRWAYFDEENGKVVLFVRQFTNSNYPTVYIGTISDTAITWGSGIVIESTGMNGGVGASYSSASKKGLFAWEDSSNNGQAIVGTLSDTTMTFGTKAQFTSNDIQTSWTYTANGVCYDSVADKFIILYQITSGSDGQGIVATISGTDVSFGTETKLHEEWNNVNTDRKSDLGKIPIIYRDSSNNPYYAEITITGTTPSKSGDAILNSNTSYFTGLSIDTSEGDVKVLATYEDNVNDLASTVIVPNGSVTTQNANLTATNFIGFAQETVADNEDVKVATTGQTDDNQSSLTTVSQYYVQTNGTLSTTAGTPSVLGGTALSSTKILIKS